MLISYDANVSIATSLRSGIHCMAPSSPHYALTSAMTFLIAFKFILLTISAWNASVVRSSSPPSFQLGRRVQWSRTFSQESNLAVIKHRLTSHGCALFTAS